MKRKIHNKITWWISLLFILVTVVYFVASVNMNIVYGSALSSSVVFLTLLFIWWYTLETRKRQINAGKQLELQFKPIVAIEFLTHSKKLKLINVGNGPAFNINIPDVELSGSGIFFQFDDIPYLQAGNSKEIDVLTVRDNRVTDFDFTAHLDPRYANRIVTIAIHYNNVEMKDMIQSFDLGTGKLRIFVG